MTLEQYCERIIEWELERKHPIFCFIVRSEDTCMTELLSFLIDLYEIKIGPSQLNNMKLITITPKTGIFIS